MELQRVWVYPKTSATLGQAPGVCSLPMTSKRHFFLAVYAAATEKRLIKVGLGLKSRRTESI